MEEFTITARVYVGIPSSVRHGLSNKNASGNKCPRRNSPLKENNAAENKCCRLVGFSLVEAICYNERTTRRYANARLKDESGGRIMRVHGHAKVMCHLMFGTLAMDLFNWSAQNMV